ncbi:MAG: hypothetical protein JXB50_14365 [Spirochaetes bacterium]|nr:hypothetical protein [Spirochaetota bacterium]
MTNLEKNLNFIQNAKLHDEFIEDLKDGKIQLFENKTKQSKEEAYDEIFK